VQCNEVEKSENHDAVPFSMTLQSKIDSTHFFYKIHPGKEKYTANCVEVNERKPGIEE